MASLDREVGGITCLEVLGELSEYLDGALAPERLAQVQAHVAECGECARFGGLIGRLVDSLRREGATARRLEAGIAARLLEAVHHAQGEDGLAE